MPASTGSSPDHLLRPRKPQRRLISPACLTITGFAVFHAVHTTLGFDRRLVFAGYRHATLIAAKTLATSLLAVAVAIYTGLVLLAFWRPTPAGFTDRAVVSGAARRIPLMPERWPEIVSAAEFARLRASDYPLEYGRAAHAEMSADAWMELIREYPDLRKWAAHNKTVPIEILSILASDPGRDVRRMVAVKRKPTPEILERLSRDEDEVVRMAVARHRRTPQHVLVQLREDPWQEIRRIAGERLGTLASTGDNAAAG